MNFSDWESVNLMIELLHTQPSDYAYTDFDGAVNRTISPRRRNAGVYLGYKISSKPGLVLNAAALVSVAVVLGLTISSIAGSN
jgi:hypothetical protein